MLHKPTMCCLCSYEAVAIYYLPRGCVALPELTVQPLCWHHEVRATPLGGMELLKDLRVMVSNGHVDEHTSRDRARSLSLDFTDMTCSVYRVPSLDTHWIRFDKQMLSHIDSIEVNHIATYLNGEQVRP